MRVVRFADETYEIAKSHLKILDDLDIPYEVITEGGGGGPKCNLPGIRCFFRELYRIVPKLTDNHRFRHFHFFAIWI